VYHRELHEARGGKLSTGAVVLAVGTLSCIDQAEPSGVCLLIDSIETSTDNLITIEDIAMTSLITALALTAAGLGHGGFSSGQCAAPQCPTKGMPCAQAPSKCAPCPQAPSKGMPCAQAPCKSMPCAQAPCKGLPCAQAPSKGYPCGGAPQCPTKAAPQY
jgi:hypothetical protein